MPNLKTLKNILLPLFFGIVSMMCSLQSIADAIIRSQAMFATTIVEYQVEDDGITVNLEIGIGDLDAFRNMMPDEIYAKLGHEPKPLRERLRSFFENDFVISADGSPPLIGRITAIGPEDRVRRDAITGEPLPADGQEPETVITVRISYAWEDPPETLVFGSNSAGSSAGVGFVVYHKGVAVNDFRYLGQRQALSLDWKDPWYSHFDARSLRRSNFAPMSGFIYVEPYEVRKEIIVRPKDLQDWVDLGLGDREIIPVGMQDEVKKTAAAFLKEHHEVIIDGDIIAPELARINFLERTLRTSRVIEPPDDLDINSAILGVIFVYPIVEPLPERVTMEWDLFNDRIQQVPGASVDQAGPLPTYLEPDSAILEWQNFLTNPDLPTLKAITLPPTALENAMAYARWVLLGLLILTLWRVSVQFRQKKTGRILAGLVVTVTAGVTAGSFWIGQATRISDDDAETVVAGLLHNVYRAFDFREEDQIYDVLAKSVEGDLLTQIYLETQRGLELANQGGARAKVKQIEVVDLASEKGSNGGFIATATWNVAGSVGHWGHIHERRNQYQAILDVQPVNGEWKLTGLEILEEQRL